MTDAVSSLRVVEMSTLKKVRRLGVDGHILVDVGDTVDAHDVVARSRRRSEPAVVDVARDLQLSDGDQVARYLLKMVGEPVRRGEVIDEKKGAFGRNKKICVSPTDGAVVSSPTSSGEIVIEPHLPDIELRAILPGKVVGTIPSRGVVIESVGAYLHAVVGVGEDTFGTIKMMVDSPTQEITQQSIDESCAGCVLVGGTVGVGAIRSAVMAEARAIVVGSIAGSTFEWLLQTPQSINVLVTEGFGLPGMPGLVFDLLGERPDQLAALFLPQRCKWRRSAAEIILPHPDGETSASPREFGVGSRVRIVRGSSFGKLATVTGLPSGSRAFPSGVSTGVVELAIDSAERLTAPKANVEFIQ